MTTMQPTRIERPWGVVILFSALALGASPTAQSPGPDASEPLAPAERVPVVLQGFVLDPQGRPAEGAVVVSSAGGQAVTDAAGGYRLEVDVPAEATCVQITAFDRAKNDLVASTTVGLSTGKGTLRVPPLPLTLGSACSPAWLPTFGAFSGTYGSVQDFIVHDDGDGPSLYAAGPGVLKWDGTSWTQILPTLGVEVLAVYDDGNGPALYAGGSFILGSAGPNRIAKWNGSTWSPLGSGISGTAIYNWGIHALAVFDDGSGPALYAGGDFTTAGGITTNRIAKWNGSSWSALASGMNSVVRALAVHDDGGGPALFVAGDFDSAGGLVARRVAKWDGATWSALGPGIGIAYPDQVSTLATYDDGSGSALHAGGYFTSAGGVAVSHLARWDGSTWTGVGGGTNARVTSLVVHDDGSGPALHAGGYFTSAGGTAASHAAKWNGTSWSALAGGVDGPVHALGVHDEGAGLELCAGGAFTNYVSKWNGSSWRWLTGGLNGGVEDLLVHDDGNGPALYAGGSFTTAGDVIATRVAKWDGTHWAALGAGMNDRVEALALFDDGSGVALHAGGRFSQADGAQVNRVAKWDGTSWSALGSGTNDSIETLTVHDDGSGTALYAGGAFTIAGGVAANRIARWDGMSWSALGSGIGTGYDGVQALAVFHDGGAPALYAGGFFSSAGGVPASGIAKWDGATWSALGGGTDGPVTALVVHDDGGGTALYVSGFFVTAGGVAAAGIARWDGSLWTAVGAGLAGPARAHALDLVVHDDGSGAALYAGGNFYVAGGLSARRVAKWDGSTWSALGRGVEGLVRALVSYDDGSGPALDVGGDFWTYDSGDRHLARWSCPPDTTAPVLACPTAVHALDRFFDDQEVVSFTVAVTDDRDPSPEVACVPPSGSTFPLGTTWVDCTATDAAGNESSCQFPVVVQRRVRPR
jgi:hypothetical protein